MNHVTQGIYVCMEHFHVLVKLETRHGSATITLSSTHVDVPNEARSLTYVRSDDAALSGESREGKEGSGGEGGERSEDEGNRANDDGGDTEGEPRPEEKGSGKTDQGCHPDGRRRR